MATDGPSYARYVRGLPAIGILALLTGLSLFLSTRWGIGVAADSTSYLGLRPQDMGHAPLYGWLMRLAALLPFDVTVPARVYHVALYAATAVVSWRLIYAATGRSSPAWAGALLVAFTSQGVVLYSTALSEPTFVFLVVVAIYALSGWIDTRQPRFLAAAFAIAGTLPAAAWFAYVARSTGTAGGRQTAFAGTADAETYYDGLLEAARYLLPTEFPEPLRLAALAAALALLAAATMAFHRRATARPASEPGRHRRLPLLLLSFAACYLAVVVLAVLVEPYLPISDRYLYPAWVALVLLGATTMPALPPAPRVRRALAVLVAAFVAFSAARAAKIAADGYEQGWAYSSKAWRSSPAVAYVNALPSKAVVYSDNPYALIYWTRREVLRVPQKIVRRLGAENPRFSLEVADMRRRLEQTRGALVIFGRGRGAFASPELEHLQQAVALDEAARLEDATVYVLADGRHGGPGGY